MKKRYICALAAVLIWSTMAAVVKSTLADIPNLEALSVSSFFGTAFLAAVNARSGALKKLRTYRPRELASMCGLGLLGMFLYSALYFYGLSKLTSQEACILNYLWPAMLVLFSCLILRERMTWLKAAALACSFAGIVILSLGGSATAAGALPGMLACVGAAACYGLFCVLNKRQDADQSIMMMLSWGTVAVCGLVLGLATETWVPVRGLQWAAILWLGVAVHALAYLLWALALQGSGSTAVIANLAFLTPLVSVGISAAVLGERLRPQAAAALALILGGILLQTFLERRGSGQGDGKDAG